MIDRHELASAAVRAVQVSPSVEVITRLVALYEIAANIPREGDQETEYQVAPSAALLLIQSYAVIAVFVVQVVPLGDVMILSAIATSNVNVLDHATDR